MQQYIGFNVNSGEYTIPILKVLEIVNMPIIRRMPQSPLYIEGVTNLRGSIIPVVNLKRLINLGDAGNIGNKVIVITSGKITFGILVDGITGVINIDKSDMEPPERFLNEHIEQVESVAKLKDRLVILLDTQKLLPLDDLSLFEDTVIDFKETGDGDKVEVIRTVETMAGKITVKELRDTKEFLAKNLDSQGTKQQVCEMMLNFMEAVTGRDDERAESIVAQLISETNRTDMATEGNLYNEVGKITRRLHDSLKEFKNAIDPGIKKLAREDVPHAVDKLQFVISRTEEAANKTIEIVERHLEETDKFSKHIKNITAPEKSINYLKSFRESFNNDMTEILTAQQFQDITGQTIKKVIELVDNIEAELLRLITTFGMSVRLDSEKEEVEPDSYRDGTPASEAEGTDKVNQADVENLLNEFGF